MFSEDTLQNIFNLQLVESLVWNLWITLYSLWSPINYFFAFGFLRGCCCAAQADPVSILYSLSWP